MGEGDDRLAGPVVDLKDTWLELEALLKIGVDRANQKVESLRRLRLVDRRQLFWIARNHHRAAACKARERQRRIGNIELRRLVDEYQVEEWCCCPTGHLEQSMGLLRGCPDQHESGTLL